MTQSLFSVLGELPSGLNAGLTVKDVADHLRDVYFGTAEEMRKRKMRKRLDYLNDRVEPYFNEMIDGVFDNDKVRADRKKFVKYAKFSNVSRRVVDELATVYSETAARNVKGDSNNERYQALLSPSGVDLDSWMRVSNQYTVLMNESLVWFSVKSGKPRINVWDPSKFSAIEHPSDPSVWLGVIFPLTRRGFTTDNSHPAYEVWTEHEYFFIDGNFNIMSETMVEHGLGLIPGVLVHRRQPTDSLLDSDFGDDITSAHDSVALLNIMMLRSQKSAVRAPYIAGDISQTPDGQALDDETLLHFQDGVVPGTLDLRNDPSSLIASAREVVSNLGANHGIPATVFNLSYSVGSGFELELLKQPLRERRMQQIMTPWRPAESRLAEVMSVVTSKYLPAMSFTADDWSIDFGQLDTPMHPNSTMRLWRTRREMGLMSTIDMIREENPEFDDARALAELEKNVLEETLRLSLLPQLDINGRPLQPGQVAAPPASTNPPDTTEPQEPDEPMDGGE